MLSASPKMHATTTPTRPQGTGVGAAIRKEIACLLLGALPSDMSLPKMGSLRAQALPVVGRLALVLQAIALPLSFMVTALFWILVVPVLPEETAVTALDWAAHGLNSVLMIVDMLLHAQPVFLGYFRAVEGVAVLYTLLSLALYGGHFSRQKTYASDCDCHGMSFPGCDEAGDEVAQHLRFPLACHPADMVPSSLSVG